MALPRVGTGNRHRRRLTCPGPDQGLGRGISCGAKEDGHRPASRRAVREVSLRWGSGWGWMHGLYLEAPIPPPRPVGVGIRLFAQG